MANPNPPVNTETGEIQEPPRSRRVKTGQTVTQAMEKREEGVGASVEKYRDSYAKVLPAHIQVDSFVRLAQGQLRRDAKLKAAAQGNPDSFLAALLECAVLGHLPGTDAFAFVPFGDEVTGMEQYQGVIERIYRAGATGSVKAHVVREEDVFAYDPDQMDKPRHRADWFGGKRGKLIGVYAYAVFKDGAISEVVIMDRDEVMKHKAMSKSANAPDSPWKKWEESMWLKSAVHELEKWVPTSAEYRREQLRAIAEADQIRANAASPAPETDIHDAEIVEEQPGGQAPQKGDGK